MSFPKLNLKKYYCKHFQIEIAGFLNNKTYSEMLGARIFSDFRENEPNMLVKNYRINGTKYAMIYTAFWPKQRKEKRIVMINRFEYQPGTAEVAGESPIKVSFPQLYSFFKKCSFDSKGKAMSVFEFPLGKFEPIVELPYAPAGLLGERKIEIFGFNMSMESKAQKYTQSINVRKESIFQLVGVGGIRERLTASLVKDKLEESFAYAQELIRKKGRKGGVSK